MQKISILCIFKINANTNLASWCCCLQMVARRQCCLLSEPCMYIRGMAASSTARWNCTVTYVIVKFSSTHTKDSTKKLVKFLCILLSLIQLKYQHVIKILKIFWYQVFTIWYLIHGVVHGVTKRHNWATFTFHLILITLAVWNGYNFSAQLPHVASP